MFSAEPTTARLARRRIVIGAMIRAMRFHLFSAVAIVVVSPVGPLQTQEPDGELLSNDGIERASVLVDSVFVDRHLSEAFVSGGDFGSYLLARLGVIPIPDDLRFRVAVDTSAIELYGRIEDLPALTRQILGPLLGIFPPQTMVTGRIQLRRVGEEVVDFRLAEMYVNDNQIPEGVLARFLTQVGSQYPVLSKTGRNLYVRIPRDGEISLEPGGVRVWIREVPPSGY